MEQNKEEFVNTNGLNLWGTSLVYDERIQGNSARLELNGAERLLLYEQYIGKPKDDMLKDCTENLGLIRSIAQGR